MRVFAVFCAILLLSACATESVVSQNAMPVATSKWKTQKYRVSGENTGLLIIRRDTGLRGAACIPGISLDDEAIAPIDQGEELKLHLSAGKHKLRASPNPNCAANTVEIFVDIEASSTTSFRLGFSKRNMIFTPSAY